MNCQLFQQALPQVIESGGNEAEQAHLRSCQACSELVRDLKYIAEQAKLLLPLHDPNPRVWNNIQESLTREGLVREGSTSKKKSWTQLGLVLAILAVPMLAALLLNYRPAVPISQRTTTAAPGTADRLQGTGNRL
jgi:predicted anti-sigma-YlaC factor YlaD